MAYLFKQSSQGTGSRTTDVTGSDTMSFNSGWLARLLALNEALLFGRTVPLPPCNYFTGGFS
jgi:hypothetical protein